MAGEEGIEPSFSDLESAMLPLTLFSFTYYILLHISCSKKRGKTVFA